ncbi:hypothetical protein HPG69_008824 [Diceros bicornis minor]|uniref:Uncharacterized protein n=1 Tax=Diceros bicornis minor TaxID=77932 RepID=A0A7J7FBQ1_DICBM|nr:hypothetical protein HPG69_008824 [Diceros bicornis minor]
MSAETMGLVWVKSSLTQVVYKYVKGKEVEDQQMTEYQGRTSILRDNITEGKAALRIYDIRASDSGNYKCYFQSGSFCEYALVELKAAGLGCKRFTEIKGHEDGGIQLDCTSVGWYPDPRAVWKDPYGEIVPALEEAYTVDTDSIFMVTMAVTIRDLSVRNVSCSINNSLLGKEKETVIFVPDSFIPSTSPWMVALAVIVLTLLLLIAGSICLIEKLHREKEILSGEEEVENEEKEIVGKELGKEHVKRRRNTA